MWATVELSFTDHVPGFFLLVLEDLTNPTRYDARMKAVWCNNLEGRLERFKGFYSRRYIKIASTNSK
jgi:hypothetical protein